MKQNLERKGELEQRWNQDRLEGMGQKGSSFGGNKAEESISTTAGFFTDFPMNLKIQVSYFFSVL